MAFRRSRVRSASAPPIKSPTIWLSDNIGQRHCPKTVRICQELDCRVDFFLGKKQSEMSRDAVMRRLRDGTQCAYCGRPATTRDHVPPKCLLEKPLPKTSITVPSCRACNEGFAKDEEYFATVLAHVGSVPELTAKVDPGGVTDRALTRRPSSPR